MQRTVINIGELKIFYEKRDCNRVPSSLGDVLIASDLKSGVYEGGFKIWECSIDLCKFLINSDQIRLQGKRVLELGCGAGLPGIVAMKQGAKHVCFQDFNEEVITLWTKVNVNLNRQADQDASCSFLFGDWDRLKTSSEEKFDVVLSSETIYNIDNYDKLLNAIDAALNENGIAILAAKAYYFGVGGSVDGFIEHVNKRRTFQPEIVWSSVGDAIDRHIVLLRRTLQ